MDGLFSEYWIQRKVQVQSAHFSGKPHTLHNTVIHTLKNGEKKYVYHLSDDTNHDSVMTFHIIMESLKIIQK